MNKNKFTEIISEKVGRVDRMISGSKTGYHNSHPKNLVVFNSNIIVNGEKVWYGDIDLTISKTVLQTISVDENVDIYVLWEMDGRFENEEKPRINSPVAIYKSNGKIKYGDLINPKIYDL